jgi:Protein of unknown function (DUF2975)
MVSLIDMEHKPSRAVRAGSAVAKAFLVVTLVFGVLLVVSIAVGLARHGDSLLYGSTLRVPLELSPDHVRGLPAGVELIGWPRVEAKVTDPTTKQMLLRSSLDLGPLIVFTAGLFLANAFMRSVREGDPFGSANVTRLRQIGFLLVLGAPLVALVNSALRIALFDSLPEGRFGELGSQGFSVPGGALIGGLGAFILAEVFAYGLSLREDVEGTV